MSGSSAGVKKCGQSTLTFNQACLEIASNDVPIQLWMKDTECYKCDFLQVADVQPNTTVAVTIETDYPVESYIMNGTDKTCDRTYHFGDLGLYGWNISQEGCDNVYIKEKPESMIINLALASTVYISLLLLYIAAKFMTRTDWFKNTFYGSVPFRELADDLGNPETAEQVRPNVQARRRQQTRMGAVDVFRGLAITVMIFVNYGGGKYAIFRHIPWNGLTVADLVFPWFIWIMGVSIAVSLRSQLRSSASRGLVFSRILKRTVLLVAIGVALNSGKKGALRLPGVLQRIGLTYFVVASIEVVFAKPQRNEQFGPWYLCPEVVDSWVQWLLVGLLAALHTCLTFLLPVPGCGAGYLGPGGRHDSGIHANCTGGAAGYIDRLVFTDRHVYGHPTCERVYGSFVPYDPEGLLGTLTSVLLAFLGVHAGRIVLCYENTHSRIKRWVVWAVITGVAAGSLCGWSQNEGLIPINKNLWSLSYVLAAASISYLMFALIYWAVDHRRLLSGVPFVYAGMNSIALYIGHEIINKQLPWRWKPVTNTHAEVLAMDLTATSIWLLVAFVLYSNDLFFTV